MSKTIFSAHGKPMCLFLQNNLRDMLQTGAFFDRMKKDNTMECFRMTKTCVK